MRTTQVSPSLFEEGNYFVWEYRDDAGGLHCLERYFVTEAEAGGTVLTIEIANKTGWDAEWQTHHKFVMDLQDAAEVHEDFDDEPIWDFRKFQIMGADGEWQKAPFCDNVYDFGN